MPRSGLKREFKMNYVCEKFNVRIFQANELKM